MELIPNIVGYHANDEQRCRQFLNGETIISSSDVHFFGFGMYFWDNLSNARYWAKEKRRKNSDSTISQWWIVRAHINTSDVLDLTDEQILDTVNKLWVQYCRLSKCNVNAPLGKKLDILFDYFECLSVYTIIKGNGRYDRIHRVEFLDGSYIVNNIKCMYCVKCRTVLLSRALEEVANDE